MKTSSRENEGISSASAHGPKPTRKNFETSMPQLTPKTAVQRILRSASVTSADILALQRSVGNRAAQRLLAPRAGNLEQRDANGVARDADQAVARASSSVGEHLPDTIRKRFEHAVGEDLSAVRVHTGSQSSEAAKAVGAKAYTVGQDIHFSAGEFAPGDPAGVHLLAHEVVHTLQQRGATSSPQAKLKVSSPGDAAEMEAEHGADAIIAGASLAIGSEADGIHREPAAGPTTDPQQQSAAITASAGLASTTAPAASQTKPASPQDLQTAHDAFNSAMDAAIGKLALIAQQQGAVVQDLKEAAKEKDPPSIDAILLAAIVGAAIKYVLPGVGSAMAALTTQALAKKAVEKAFEKGAEEAANTAKEKITSVEDGHVADAYFNGMKVTYPALAGHYQDAFRASMDALWAGVGSDPAKASDAQLQANGAQTALQKGLDSGDFAQRTKDGAFSGFSNLLAQKNAGGVLFLTTTVAGKGNIGGRVIEKAEILGISSRLKGLAAGRPLSAYNIAVSIEASYFTEGASIGGAGTDSDVANVHTFTVEIDAKGKAKVPAYPDPWLLDRGNGNASVGAQGLYDDLKAVPINFASK